MSTTQEAQPKAEPKILFQDYFKSVGPRTYAAQVKEAVNGNHFIVLTEGKRDKDSEQVRKTKLLVFSEDFETFFAMVRRTAEYIKDHPVPEDVRRRQAQWWKNRKNEAPAGERRK
jgi:Protein of unknown function (DUF3276)